MSWSLCLFSSQTLSCLRHWFLFSVPLSSHIFTAVSVSGLDLKKHGFTMKQVPEFCVLKAMSLLLLYVCQCFSITVSVTHPLWDPFHQVFYLIVVSFLTLCFLRAFFFFELDFYIWFQEFMKSLLVFPSPWSFICGVSYSALFWLQPILPSYWFSKVTFHVWFLTLNIDFNYGPF